MRWASEYRVPGSHGIMTHLIRSGIGRLAHIKVNGMHIRVKR